MALETLRKKKMSLSATAEKFGIPSTTLWQKAARAGIATPKKESYNKNWKEDGGLEEALEVLKKGTKRFYTTWFITC